MILFKICIVRALLNIDFCWKTYKIMKAIHLQSQTNFSKNTQIFSREYINMSSVFHLDFVFRVGYSIFGEAAD